MSGMYLIEQVLSKVITEWRGLLIIAALACFLWWRIKGKRGRRIR